MNENTQVVPTQLASASPRQITEAYRYCSAIVHHAAGNFYYAFLLLPKARRKGIHALYAFCRAGDDAADDPEPVKDRRLALLSLQKKLNACYNGFYTDRLTLALADAIRVFQFDRHDFDDLLLGIESDLTPVEYHTVEEQSLYCYRVASTVGLLCLKVFGADDAKDREYAIELGKAMQLTNILRDLREDHERGRLYIPTCDLNEAGVEAERLFDADSRDKLEKLVLINAARARKHFDDARSVMPSEHAGKLLAARAMGAIYEAILCRIEANPLSPKRVELSRLEKLTIVKSLLFGKVL